jgi:hypothetical protein
MRGWTRLGIVVSVLWTLVVPFWLVAQANSSAKHDLERCLSLATSLSGDHRDAAEGTQVYDRVLARCQMVYRQEATSLPQLIADDDGKKRLALRIGGPIAALWLLGALAIWALRLVLRGF